MKIALFTDTFYPDINGVAKTLYRYTKYLDKKKISYLLFSPQNSYDDETAEHVYTQSSFPFPLYPDCRISFPNSLHIRSILKNFKPDIIHVTTPFSIGLAGLQYAKKNRIPIVASYHTDFEKYLSYYHMGLLSKTFWRYMEWFHQPMERIFVPSPYTLNQLKERNFKHLEIWDRGVDTKTFHPIPSRNQLRKKYNIRSKYIVCYVGRLSPEKNIDLLKNIIEKIPTPYQNDIHWIIAGDGPSRANLTKINNPHVTFTGFLNQQDIATIYASSDIFVFPSTTETFGNVVLESMACGTPVIGANAGGVKTIIKDSFNGILCKEEDEDVYIEAIMKLLDNDYWRKQMSQHAMTFAKKQEWDQKFEDLLHGYQEVLFHSQQKKLHAFG
ncbi:glycosyltransferase family 4 protein [Saliterribacillus persicus]|uniref:Glycosyltransferase involved in cell wall biosynthesis n=1 Tax=Saliterribacillus persicus TaxID=930114 RepID=A0A368XHB1_9BACI|nr:glycosyltransferase family 1 protein [Saliterribacillus persicus]RCW66989.1 glycosyltransferase involved in cell wall biosynthesis [Saliterribacillus persicus]